MNTMMPSLAALLAVPAVLTAPALADGSVIYPCPQQIEIARDMPASVTSVQVLLRKADSQGGLWDRVPAGTEGAYAVQVEGQKMTVYANDEHGVFYAKQSICQLLEGVPNAKDAQRDPFPNKSLEEVAKMGKLPSFVLVDWPDLPFRGVVEGYYGTPWSFEARKAQFEFYGRNKMNTYIYAPKDDPFHHGAGCYQPYPEEKAKELAALVSCAKKNHVKFVWAIHPSNTVNWGDNNGKKELDGLCKKLQWMYDLGLRDFGVFVDDSHGEICKASRQVQLCNYIYENFIKKHPEVTQRLIMCPTGYNKSWAKPNELAVLGDGLNKGVDVMWTGDTVVHDIELGDAASGGQRWVNNLVKRPTFIWWNWPCQDFKRGRVSMGRTYGLDQSPEMKNEMSGFVANPMEYAEASKVGLFGVADYMWNIAAFDSEEAWRSGISRLYPNNAESLLTFCQHNSYMLPNTHGYYREESADDAELLGNFANRLRRGEKPDEEMSKGMTDTFHKVAESGAKLLGEEKLKQEIAPWLKKFRLTGEAGEALMQALAEQDKRERGIKFFRAVDRLTEMNLLTRKDWSPNGVREMNDVEVGALLLSPALKSLYDYLSPRVTADIDGRRYKRPKFIYRGGQEPDTQNLTMDGDSRTFWASQQRQAEGDWYGLDFGSAIPIRTIALEMGGPRGNDYVERGQMEYSTDGKKWRKLGSPRTGSVVTMNLAEKPIRARSIRYRVLEPRQNWAAVCEFSVNRPLRAAARSSVEKFRNLGTTHNDKMVGINRVMEYCKMPPKAIVELSLPRPEEATWLEVDLGNEQIEQWAQVEVTLADGSVTRPKMQRKGSKLICSGKDLPRQNISSMKLINKGKEEQEVRLNTFKMDVKPAPLDEHIDNTEDGDYTTVYNCSRKGIRGTLTVPIGTTQVTVIGKLKTCKLSPVLSESVDGRIHIFKLKPGTSKLRLEIPKQEGYVNEILIR